MCRLSPCIHIFKGKKKKKSVKKCACVAVLKIALLLVKNIFFNVKKCISEFWRYVAQKHTTCAMKIINCKEKKYDTTN